MFDFFISARFIIGFLLGGISIGGGVFLIARNSPDHFMRLKGWVKKGETWVKDTAKETVKKVKKQ